jgi:lysophospholipase L1-like esterase
MSKTLVVFGDSVTWGQGHPDSEKFTTQVAAALSLDVAMRAHSGAVIGVNNQETGSCRPEAPHHTPTILQQVAANTDDPNNTALVVSNGGINDIGVQYILNPFTSDDGLKSKVEEYCFNDMFTLLRTVLARFQNNEARIVVTSYFPIFSPKSDFKLILDYISHGLFIAPSPAMTSRAEIEAFVFRSVHLAMLFWTESRKQLRAAVDATHSSRVFFADVPFTEDNAMFVKDTAWLYNVHLEGGVLVAEDPLADSRRGDCKLCHPNDPIQQAGCNLASAGHPNIPGANAFAKTILDVLR